MMVSPYANIQLPITRGPSSTSQFALPVRAAILDIDTRLNVLEVPLEQDLADWVPVMLFGTWTVTYAKVQVVGHKVWGNFKLVCITAGAGNYTCTMPYAFAQSADVGMPCGHWTVGTGTTRYAGWLWQIGAQNVAFGTEAAGRMSNTSPFAIVAGSEVHVSFEYWI